jgi:lysophospholipase L1-like esterase
MRLPKCFFSTALLICASAFSTSTALGQSLSLIKGETNYWIEASAPAGNPHTLQGSANLHLWVDIKDNVQERSSIPLENVGADQRYFRLIPTPAPPAPIRVLLLGDSMTSDCCGWGGGMYGYFKPEATVINYAMAWTSTRVFLSSAEKDKMLLLKPDYVLIQYGFMDGGTDEDRNTTPEQFAENLRTIAGMVRGFNGVPILVTLHSARLFDENGKVIPAWYQRNDVTKQVAAELGAHLIDLNQLSMDLLNELGPSGSAFMELVPNDVMHVSALGGQYFARLVVNALPDSLGPYLTGILDPPPKP